MKRHLVNVMRPTGATGSLGELEGQDQVYIPNQPCRIKPVSGTEDESARQLSATRQYLVEMTGNPRKPINETMWLHVLPLTNPPRKLNIAYVNDRDDNGINLTLSCGEN